MAAVRAPAPVTKRMPIEITVPDLARACGLSPERMLRRLRAEDVVLRRRGKGTQRVHRFVTLSDLRANANWILDEIESWNVLLEQRRPRAPPDDEDD